MNQCMGIYCKEFNNKYPSCKLFGIFPECSYELRQAEHERLKHWCPVHGYPVPCTKCGYPNA